MVDMIRKETTYGQMKNGAFNQVNPSMGYLEYA